jgi:hypothetical protein
MNNLKKSLIALGAVAALATTGVVMNEPKLKKCKDNEVALEVRSESSIKERECVTKEEYKEAKRLLLKELTTQKDYDFDINNRDLLNAVLYIELPKLGEFEGVFDKNLIFQLLSQE